MTIMMLNADQTAYNLLSQLVQPNEQRESVKESSVSYSEAAYHMAEGAAVTTAACLPTIICFGSLFNSDNYIFDLRGNQDKFMLAMFAGFSGYSFPVRYALKVRDCGKTEYMKKDMIHKQVL